MFRKTTGGEEDDDGCRDVLYAQNVINMKLLYVIHSRPLSTDNDDGRTNANTTTATSTDGIT